MEVFRLVPRVGPRTSAWDFAGRAAETPMPARINPAVVERVSGELMACARVINRY
jgi:hypothetical protein